MQLSTIYPSTHPKCKEGNQRLYDCLKALFDTTDKVIMGIVGAEIAIGAEVFFELSNKFKTGILSLKDKDIERIIIHKNVSLDELILFSKILSEKKEAISSYKDYLRVSGIEHIRVDRLAEGDYEAGGTNEEEAMGTIYDFFSSMLQGKEFDMVKVKLTINEFLGGLVNSQKLVLGVNSIKKYDTSTFLHSINVALLAMFFASKLGYTKEDILDIGIAGLLHDMGKIFVSKKIIQKPGVLTEEEFAAVKSHAHLGGKILLKFVNSVGILPVVVAFEHHINWDYTGYPQITYKIIPNIASRIIAMCDTYDALRCRREYKKPYPPNMIYNIMNQQKGKRFDPELLERFFQEIGMYPLGTLVKLNNDMVAIVKEQNKEDVFKPKIEVLKPFELAGKRIDLVQEKEISIVEIVEQE